MGGVQPPPEVRPQLNQSSSPLGPLLVVTEAVKEGAIIQ